ILQLCAVPTHSPHNPDCAWLFLNNIAKVTPCPETKRAQITSPNNITIELNCSHYRTTKQMERGNYLFNSLLANYAEPPAPTRIVTQADLSKLQIDERVFRKVKEDK